MKEFESIFDYSILSVHKWKSN